MKIGVLFFSFEQLDVWRLYLIVFYGGLVSSEVFQSDLADHENSTI